MKIEINENAMFSFPVGNNTYKLKGLYFESTNSSSFNDVITDFDNNPIAYIQNRHCIETSNQSRLEEIVVKKYHVAYFDGMNWVIASLKYESIPAFHNWIGNSLPAYLLKED